jgi:hypothetical protein
MPDLSEAHGSEKHGTSRATVNERATMIDYYATATMVLIIILAGLVTMYVLTRDDGIDNDCECGACHPGFLGMPQRHDCPCYGMGSERCHQEGHFNASHPACQEKLR